MIFQIRKLISQEKEVSVQINLSEFDPCEILLLAPQYREDIRFALKLIVMLIFLHLPVSNNLLQRLNYSPFRCRISRVHVHFYIFCLASRTIVNSQFSQSLPDFHY